MNYAFQQEYEIAATVLYQATLSMNGQTTLVIGVNEFAFVHWQAALQNFTSAKRKFFEETAFSNYETFAAALNSA